MLRTLLLANASGTVGAVLYILCAVLAKVAPGFLVYFFQNWFHGVQLSAVATGPEITVGSFIVGLVSFVAFVWVTAAAGGALYGLWSRDTPRVGKEG